MAGLKKLFIFTIVGFFFYLRLLIFIHFQIRTNNILHTLVFYY